MTTSEPSRSFATPHAQAPSMTTVPPTASPPHELAFDARDVSVWYGEKQTLFKISLGVRPRSITAIIGPSGCGKSTFLRCLNRMHELVPSARMEGKITLFGDDLYAPTVDPGVCAPPRRHGFSRNRIPFPPCRSRTTWSPGCA